jgi:hypothetical protein
MIRISIVIIFYAIFHNHCMASDSPALSVDSSDPTSTPTLREEMQLTGTSSIEGRKYCIINGIVLMVNDLINGMLVKEINNDSVVLTTPNGGEVTLTMR